MIDCTDAFWVLVDEHGRLVVTKPKDRPGPTIYPSELSAKRARPWVKSANKVSVRKAYLALAVEGE